MLDQLVHLYERYFGASVARIMPVNADGSDRKLYRMRGAEATAIGVENYDRAENIAFLGFSRHFRKMALPVPEIYAEDLDNHVYLEEDLGERTLYDTLMEFRDDKNSFPAAVNAYYEQAVRLLPEFQIRAGKQLDYQICYPRRSFDRQSMLWDLNYFKYYFIKLAQIPFNEQQLEDDFDTFITFLCHADADYFLYRDFQSRNIMIRDEQTYFIDYQGGRRGALQYDIASLLYDAKADLPSDMRKKLLSLYLESARHWHDIDPEDFMRYYDGFVLIRMLQAMGAYGFRGFYERKSHFLQSVPFAIRNLEYLLKEADFGVAMPALLDILQKIVRSTRLRELGDVRLPLTVRVQSFAYKNGLPGDDTGHGGGFVFDCRALPNPGRLDAYKAQTGNDPEVVQFLEQKTEVVSFLVRIRDLIGQVIENYQRRNFSHLQISFGCTGGQHRSVYCANMLAKYLSDKYPVKVEVAHRESADWPQASQS
jgi:aminoglycoside/choline kinase family phosphotransferase